MLGHGGSSAGSYLADPTSPIPSHYAVIILFKSVPVHQLSWLAPWELILKKQINKNNAQNTLLVLAMLACQSDQITSGTLLHKPEFVIFELEIIGELVKLCPRGKSKTILISKHNFTSVNFSTFKMKRLISMHATVHKQHTSL